MEYAAVMSLPSETPNKEIYNLLRDSVTPEDIRRRTKPDLFACSHLIAWAVKHKKFDEYYSYMAQFKEDQKRFDAQEKLIAEMTVLVRFDCAGVPLFGFLTEIDGDDALRFPTKDGINCVYL